MTFIVSLALVPALALLVHTGYGKLRDDVVRLKKTAQASVSAFALRQSGLIDEARVALHALSRLEPVQNLDPEAAARALHDLSAHSLHFTDLRLCLPDGSIAASAELPTASSAALPAAPAAIPLAAPLAEPLSDAARAAVSAAAASPGFSVRALSRRPDPDFPALPVFFTATGAKGEPFVLTALLPIRLSPEEEARLQKAHVEHMHLLDRHGNVIFAFPACASPERPAKLPARQALSDIVGPEADNEEHIVFDRLHVPGLEEQGLSIVLGVSTDAIYQRMREQIVLYVVLLAAFLSIALFAALGLYRRCLLEPVGVLLTAASRLKTGNLDARVRASGMPLELRRLGEALNTMAASVEKRDGQLSQAKDAADSASRAKTAFLSTMSHEIRTPMNAITGMSYLCSQEELSAKQQHYLAAIREAGTKLLVVINDILDFSKAQAGNLDMENIPFSIRDVLAKTEIKAGDAARRKGVGFSLSFAEDLPHTLTGDPLHLTQVFANLAGIAVRLTSSGEVDFACSFTRSRARELTLEVTITASGRGLSYPALTALLADGENGGGDPAQVRDLNIALTGKLVGLLRGVIAVEALENGSAAIRLSLPCSEYKPEKRDSPTGKADAATPDSASAAQ